MTYGPNDIAVVCVRVKDQPKPIRGAVSRPCHECIHRVWCAPGTQRRLAEFDATHEPYIVVCVQCSEGLLEKTGPHRWMGPIDPAEVARELAGWVPE